LRDALMADPEDLTGIPGREAELHARYDPRETTKPARRAFNQRFLDQVDPDRRLSDRERHRRAEAARRAYFTRLAYLSARKRRSIGRR